MPHRNSAAIYPPPKRDENNLFLKEDKVGSSLSFHSYLDSGLLLGLRLSVLSHQSAEGGTKGTKGRIYYPAPPPRRVSEGEIWDLKYFQHGCRNKGLFSYRKDDKDC